MQCPIRLIDQPFPDVIHAVDITVCAKRDVPGFHYVTLPSILHSLVITLHSPSITLHQKKRARFPLRCILFPLRYIPFYCPTLLSFPLRYIPFHYITFPFHYAIFSFYYLTLQCNENVMETWCISFGMYCTVNPEYFVRQNLCLRPVQKISLFPVAKVKKLESVGRQKFFWGLNFLATNILMCCRLHHVKCRQLNAWLLRWRHVLSSQVKFEVATTKLGY